MSVCFLVHSADDFRPVGLPVGTEALEDRLVHLLILERGVLVHAIILELVSRHLLDRLGLAQSVVQHTLVIVEQRHLALEALVPVVLRPREGIIAFLEGSRVRLTSLGIVVKSRILSQIIVECALLISGLVNSAQASGTVRDIGVTTATVVRVDDGLRVDMRQSLPGSLLADDE